MNVASDPSETFADGPPDAQLRTSPCRPSSVVVVLLSSVSVMVAVAHGQAYTA